MTDQDPTAIARSAVEGILTALNVDRVVCVDDTYNSEVSLEDVLAAAAVLESEELVNIFPEFGKTNPEDADVRNRKLREIWGVLGGEAQSRRADAALVAARRHDGDEADDLADASILSALIPQEMLLSISPTQWDEQKETLLSADAGQRTLFLFDQDFSAGGGDSEGGIKIIASLLSSADSESLICGLLTHTVTPETQSERWAELSEQHNIPKDRFVVIPKLHLSKDPILFAQTLKFVALCPDFTELKRKTRNIIARAADSAASRIDDVSICDLDYIVFQVSAGEGLWEPDMLFRLHALFHRLESRRLAHEGSELEDLAARLREVSNIPAFSTAFPSPSNAWNIQHDEMYETGVHINQNHLPLELGDIFERVDSESQKRYILLAQPCDLMVRRDGKRHPELTRVPLAEVVCKNEQPKFSNELPYYDSSSAERWYVKLRSIHHVEARTLDLCVLNRDGMSKVSISGGAPQPIRPTWKKRFAFLQNEMKRLVSPLDDFSPLRKDSPEIKTMKQKLLHKISGPLLREGLFKGQIAEEGGTRTLRFDCKRSARLTMSRALGLLMEYTSCLGRPAYDRDFGSRP